MATYSIDYDDGEKESGVAEELIRVLEEAPAPAPAPASGKYAVGAKVEARYRGKKKWYAGEVTKVDGDVYSVTYEDGDVEDGVAEELIRAVEEAAPAPAPAAAAAEDGKYAVGSKVECRYKGKKRYYPGRVASYSGGEYSIDYDDGEKESGVAEELIRALEEAAPAPAAGPATHQRLVAASRPVCRSSLDTREKEMVPRHGDEAQRRWHLRDHVRRRGQGVGRRGGLRQGGRGNRQNQQTPRRATGGRRAGASASRRAAKVFDKGDEDRGFYKGKKNWYSGVVDRYDADAGTYDVTYDDGDKEEGVKQENIARAWATPNLKLGRASRPDTKEEEARYPGKIAARSDDTYDIDYDDGEKESGVARNLIREARVFRWLASYVAGSPDYRPP